MLEKVHHLGHAVEDLQVATSFYCETFDAKPGEPEEVSHQGVRTVMLCMGSSRVELLEPTQPDSPVAKFLAKRGEGFHHVAFEVDELEASITQLKKSGIELIDDKPQIGAGGTRTAFVLHPKDAFGTLVELVEETH